MKVLFDLQTILLGVILSGTYTYAASLVAEASQVELHFVGQKNCQFVPPLEWLDRSISWSGSCRSGKAHGQGVLKAYKEGKNTLVFFGSLEYGELKLGVIDNTEGFIAGQFEQGVLVPDLERNVIINAFRNASVAAKAYSQQLIKVGNKRSTEFYLKKAEELEQQMD